MGYLKLTSFHDAVRILRRTSGHFVRRRRIYKSRHDSGKHRQDIPAGLPGADRLSWVEPPISDLIKQIKILIASLLNSRFGSAATHICGRHFVYHLSWSSFRTQRNAI